MFRGGREGDTVNVPIRVQAVDGACHWLTVRELMGPRFREATAVAPLVEALPDQDPAWQHPLVPWEKDFILPGMWQTAWHALLSGPNLDDGLDHFRSWLFMFLSYTEGWADTFAAIHRMELSTTLASSKSLKEAIRDVTGVPGYEPPTIFTVPLAGRRASWASPWRCVVTRSVAEDAVALEKVLRARPLLDLSGPMGAIEV